MGTIDNRKDVVLLLLYAPGTANKPHEPILGRTRLMKLIYLLDKEKGISERLGIKQFYQFYAHNYGPFSEEVFEDVDFLRNVGLIKAEPRGPQSIIEAWEEEQILAESAPSDSDDLFGAFEQELFELTTRGVHFVEDKLLPDLDENSRGAIEGIKKGEGALSLSSLLRYVYSKYPESASKSKLPYLRSNA